MLRLLDAALPILLLLSACGLEVTPQECTSSIQCTLSPQGECVGSLSGAKWCRYPDHSCPGGIRWSPEAGDGLASACAAASTVHVRRQGSGSGTVTSGSGIDCGDICSTSIVTGTTATLIATPDSASTFAGWDGDAESCGQSMTCVLSVLRDADVAANFEKSAGLRLAVEVNGDGQGRVLSSDALIDCGSVCLHDYAAPATVTLSAETDTSSTSITWGGDAATCGSSAVCTIPV